LVSSYPPPTVKMLDERAALSNTERLLLRFKSLYVN